MPRRAYSYARFSSKKQADGDSKRRQLAFARELCREHGWALDDSFAAKGDGGLLDEGVSAFRGRNKACGALAEFLRAVKSGRVSAGSILIVESLDRLSRQDVDEAYDLVRSLLKAGITVATREPRRVYQPSDRNDMLNILEWLFIAARAHDESRVKSMRAREAWLQRKRLAASERRPTGKRCPAWLELTAAGYRLREPLARGIREIFRLACEGLGGRRIARTLAARPKEFPHANPNGWTPEYVWRILRSRATVGEYQPRRRGAGNDRPAEGDPVPGYYPALVTEQDWLTAQAAVAGRKRRSGRPGTREANLFTGIVFDAESRARLSVRACTVRSRGRAYRYQWLRDYRSRTGVGFRYDQFEEAVLEALRELRTRDVLPAPAEHDERERRITDLTGRVVALDHRADVIQQQIADPDQDAAVVPALVKALKQVAADQAATAKELKALKEESLTGRGEALGQAQSLVDLLAGVRGTPEEGPLRLRIKAALRCVVEEVWVRPQRLARQQVVLHVQIYLRGGRRKYLRKSPPNPPPGLVLWDLAHLDFRAGDVEDVADRAEAGTQRVG